MRPSEALPLPNYGSDSDLNPRSDDLLMIPVGGKDPNDDALDEPGPRIDKRFLIIVLISSIVLGMAFVLVHDWQVRGMQGTLLERARSASLEGKHDEYIRYFIQYLRMVPSDTEARVDLVLLMLSTAESPRRKLSVLLLLERVLRSDSDRTDVRRKAIEISMEFGRYGDAMLHL